MKTSPDFIHQILIAELTIFYWGAGFGIRTGDSIKYSCTAVGLWNSLRDRSSFNQFKGRLDKYLEGNPLQVTWKIVISSQKIQHLCLCSSPTHRLCCLWTLGSLGFLWGEVKPQIVFITENLQGSEKAKGRLGQGGKEAIVTAWRNQPTELLQSSWALTLHACGKADV